MKRFTTELTAAIKEIMAKEPRLRRDSPVYKFLERLTPSWIREEETATAAAAEAITARAEPAGAGDAGATAYSEMMRKVDEAQKKGKAGWIKAKILLEEMRETRKAKSGRPEDKPTANSEDPYILQRLALATYKSKYPSPGGIAQKGL